MFENLTMLRTAMAMAQHAGARQALTAANMANADTPGYRAKWILPFSDVYASKDAEALRQTRSAHQTTAPTIPTAIVQTSDAQSSPNGNSVSLEEEMVRAVEIQREHNRALTIYKHSLDVLRTSLGRR